MRKRSEVGVNVVEPIVSFSGEYRFLSNFYAMSVIFQGYRYPTVEHAYQAAKNDSPVYRERIQLAQRPGEAKRLGRMVPLREDWEEVKVRIMRNLVAQKFMDPVLRDKLRNTGRANLVEGNHWGDRFWGQCPVGNGENWLGRILMEVRDAQA